MTHASITTYYRPEDNLYVPQSYWEGLSSEEKLTFVKKVEQVEL